MSISAPLIVHLQQRLVGLTRFELVTPRLSSVCSNQLSYRPFKIAISRRPEPVHRPVKELRSATRTSFTRPRPVLSKLNRRAIHELPWSTRSILIGLKARLRAKSYTTFSPFASDLSPFSRKEVIQPQVLLQLPCYDFTPITNHTLGACLPCGLAQRLLVQPAFVM